MTKKEEQYKLRKWQILDIALNHFIRYGYYVKLPEKEMFLAILRKDRK